MPTQPPSHPLAALALAAVTCVPSLAQWTVRPLSVQRASVGAATVGTRVILAGGAWAGVASDAVDIYDDATGLWSTSTLPAPAIGLHGDSVGPYALFATPGLFSDVVFVFDSRVDTWSTATLSARRGSVDVVTSGTKVLFAGGDALGVGSDVVDIYDYALGAPSDPAAWSTTTLSDRRDVAAGFKVEDAAVFVGGDNALASSPRMDAFDGVSDTSFSADLPSGWLPRAGTGLGSRAIMSTASLGLWRFEIYDFATGTSTLGPSHGFITRLGAATLGDRALFAGTGQLNPPAPGVWIYNGLTDAWSTSLLPVDELGLSSAVVGTKAIFAGGFYGGNVLIFDDQIGTSYCSPAVPNSTGVPATITAQGAPAVALGGSTRFTVQDLPAGSVGYVLASQSQGSSMPATSQGLFCLDGSVVRLNRPGSLVFGTEDSVSFDHATIPGPTQATIRPGETWHFQCWHRDANPTSTSNFTDAISITYQ